MKPTPRQLGTLALLCAAPLLANADILGVSFSGQVVDIDSTTGAATQLAAAGPSFNSLAGNGSLYWSVETNSGRLATINPVTGVATLGPVLTGLTDQTSIRGLAFAAGSLLAAQNTGGAGSIGPDSLYRVDPVTGAAVLIGATGLTALQALATDASGQLFGWDIGSGLMRIDTSTGQATDVNTAIGADGEIQALAFSAAGVLYGARDRLFTINTVTGASSLVGDITGGSDVRGIEFTSTVPEPQSWALLVVGLAGVASVLRRRQQR